MLSIGLFTCADGFDPKLLYSGLTNEEYAAYQHRRGSPRAEQYLGSRWLIRQHLASELGCPARDVPIVHAAGARPRCLDSGLYIGLSHSRDLCLSVVCSGGSAGCDIEGIKPRRHGPELIAQAYFDPYEAQALAEHDDPVEQLTDFYRLWTLKEAAWKALGQDLAGRFSRPAFILRPTLRCHVAPDDGVWQFAVCDMRWDAEQFVLAVAGRCHDTEIVLTHFEPQPGALPLQTRIDPYWQCASSC